jgi:aryl-alcohol dehydrogenase-like predicted oxidoreductase
MNENNATKISHPSRRDFLKLGGALTAALAAPGLAGAALGNSPQMSGAAVAGAMPTRNLGKTGQRVGIFSLGGQAALERGNNEAVAVPIIERALDLGVNYIDTSSIYGGPERWSEKYIGQVMKTRRAQAYLASKTKDRTRDGSLRMLEKSLKLLQTDHLDLWQLHDIGTPGDIAEVFAKGGAMEALIEARDQKMVRHLGITGHHRPECLIEGINRFPFDCILLAVNAADKHHYSFMQELLPLAVEKQMGIIGMKLTGRSRLLSSWTPPPLERQKRMWEGIVEAKTPGTLTMREAMYYCLSLPISTAIIGIDSLAQLEENVRLAQEFTPFSEAQLAALAQRAEPVSKQALFFRFFDRA